MSNEMNTAALLRASADGELDSAGEERLRAHLEQNPGDASRVEFERGLRGAVEHAMHVETPAGLRERVIERLRAEDELADAIEARSEQTRKASFWSGPLGSVLSVAAVLALAFVGLQIATTLVGSSGTEVHASELEGFVGKQHDACLLNPAIAERKFVVNEMERVPDQFESLTGRALGIEELVAGQACGLRFVGAGECRVPPANERSLHLRFVGEDEASVSVFVQGYSGYLDMEDERVYRIGGDEPPEVYGWRRGGVVYYLVASEPGPCERFRAAMGLPEPEPLE